MIANNLKRGTVIELPSRLGLWRVASVDLGPLFVEFVVIGCTKVNANESVSLTVEPFRFFNVRA